MKSKLETTQSVKRGVIVKSDITVNKLINV